MIAGCLNKVVVMFDARYDTTYLVSDIDELIIIIFVSVKMPRSTYKILLCESKPITNSSIPTFSTALTS